MSDVPVLWQLEISHFNEKVRWALDYKRIAHERRSVAPGLHRFHAWRLGAGDRLPALVLGDHTVGDSTAIVAALEELRPNPALYPADERGRTRALELEEFFDEEVAHDVRRAVFEDALGDAAFVTDLFFGDRGGLVRGAMRAAHPLMQRVVRHDYGIDPESAERGRATVRSAFDRVEAELQPSGYLVGESFSVADLTAAALLSPIVIPPEVQFPRFDPRRLPESVQQFRESLRARRGYHWVGEMFRRHRGSSAEVRRPGEIGPRREPAPA